MNAKNSVVGLGIDVGGTSTEVVALSLGQDGLTLRSVIEYQTAKYRSLGAAFDEEVRPVLGESWPEEFGFVLCAAAGLPDDDGVTHFCYPGGRLAWDDLCRTVRRAGLSFGYGNDAEVQGGILLHTRVHTISESVQSGLPGSKQLNADTALLFTLGTGSGTAFRVGERILTSEGGNRLVPAVIERLFPDLCASVQGVLRGRDPEWTDQKWRAECLFSQSGLSDMAHVFTRQAIRMPWEALCQAYRENAQLRELAAEILGISVGDWAVILKPAQVLLRCELLREVPEILTAPDGQAAFRRGIERQPTRKELALEVPVRLITIENAQLIGMGLFAAKKWYPDLLACI
jgi:hypothetical protein